MNKNLPEMLALITAEVAGKFMFGESFQQYKIDGVPIGLAGQRLIADLVDDAISLPRIILGNKGAYTNILPEQRRLNAEILTVRRNIVEMVQKELNRGEGDTTKFVELIHRMRKDMDCGEYVTDDQIADDFTGFFMAGTDTTSHLVASAIYFLWKNPNVLSEVRKEADREFFDLTKVDDVNINRMSYTSAVLKEAFRLEGPISIFLEKAAVEDTNLCEMKVKKGTIINVCLDIFFRSDKYYSRPMEFLPERWLGDPAFEKDGYKREPYAFIPFAAGPRNCIGQHLAMIEARIIVALFIKTFDFSFDKILISS